MALEIWNTAADCLRKSLGQNNFKSWIEPLKFIGEADGIAEFSVPTSFFGSTIFLEINFLEPKFFFLAIIFSLVAQIGDLTISYFKRIEKVKDTGKILPGHGGILDRIDGLMFVAILVFILKQINIIP